ncbi:hypothetical protein IJG91_01105, partial [Candidatus Saccharibacteria bacterium]|nr:hypothetical protein [Candidatus Saccharibacteria bacterium]
ENRQIDNKNAATEHGQTPVTIGTNVSSAIASGTYRNELELTAVANPLPIDYSLTFNANTEEVVTNMPVENPMTETSVAAQVSFTIPNTIPKGDQWLFKEWNTEPDGSGVSYSPGSDFVIVADTTSAQSTKKTLYAIWETVVAFTSGGLTWTKQLGATTFSNASSLCPTGYRLPSSSELDRLIGSPNYGWSTSSSVRTTYNAWSIGDGRYNSSYVWSSTRWSSGSRTGAYNLYYESSSRAIVTVIQQNWTSAQYQVACVK